MKTLADPAAIMVNTAPLATTITALNNQEPHCSALPDGRTCGPEFQVDQVIGVVQITRNEADDGGHLTALADPNDPSHPVAR